MRSGRDLLLTDEQVRRRTRRSFLIGGVAAVAGIGGYEWMKSAQTPDGIPKLERRVLEFNGRLGRGLVSSSRLMPTFSREQVRYLKPNGDVGLKTAVEDWSLHVTTNAAPQLTLAMPDIHALPRTEMITRFCCIEGWATVVQWAGVRFSDFTRKYFPPGKSLPPYVSMSTPDEDYYVGLDRESALHPQTLLAYEKDGAPLTAQHGAPLRLVIPVKYGVKSIKRIGSIEYTGKRPADYWADEGYDWFAGL